MYNRARFTMFLGNCMISVLIPRQIISGLVNNATGSQHHSRDINFSDLVGMDESSRSYMRTFQL